MNIEEYKKQINYPVCQRTLCFLVDGDRILLGVKKMGFGQGKYLGIGGKIIEGETPEDAVKRETEEEIFVKIKELQKVGKMGFYFPYVDNPQKWTQEVHVFLVTKWEGEPKESEEIKPVWFEKDKIPYDLMWPDAKLWMPKFLKGEKVSGDFLYGKDGGVVEYELF